MFPWGAMLRAALSAGIAPEAFWRLSLREWRWLAAQGDGMSRGRMMALMEAFPDTHPCHPGRSEAESRDPAASSAMGPG
jgi:uncharacterized phage protein (TIGR02216 family)